MPIVFKPKSMSEDHRPLRPAWMYPVGTIFEHPKTGDYWCVRELKNRTRYWALMQDDEIAEHKETSNAPDPS